MWFCKLWLVVALLSLWPGSRYGGGQARQEEVPQEAQRGRGQPLPGGHRVPAGGQGSCSPVQRQPSVNVRRTPGTARRRSENGSPGSGTSVRPASWTGRTYSTSTPCRAGTLRQHSLVTVITILTNQVNLFDKPNDQHLYKPSGPGYHNVVSAEIH